MGTIGPGPIYSLPPTIGYEKHDQRKSRSPQYSMAGRLKVRTISITPGPSINTQGSTRYGRTTGHAFTMAPKNLRKGAINIGPGPANYDLSKRPYVSAVAPPTYSFGKRNNFRFKNQFPAPNSYGIRDGMVKKSAPAYSMGASTNFKVKMGSPGPANYPAVNLRTTMHKAPQYSLYGRAKGTYKSIVPGPNAYNRASYTPGKSPPSYSFGIRHSAKAPPMVVPCDNVQIKKKME